MLGKSFNISTGLARCRECKLINHADDFHSFIPVSAEKLRGEHKRAPKTAFDKYFFVSHFRSFVDVQAGKLLLAFPYHHILPPLTRSFYRMKPTPEGGG
jgi:hypothetical protein